MVTAGPAGCVRGATDTSKEFTLHVVGAASLSAVRRCRRAAPALLAML
jgi:hypothetical protein